MPVVAVLGTVTVSVVLPFPGEAMLVGDKVPAAPFGKPDSVNATADLNPPLIVVVRIILAGEVERTVALPVLAPRVKFGTVMVRDRGKVLMTVPPVAFTVKV